MQEHLEELRRKGGRLVAALRPEQLELLCQNLPKVHYHPHELITKQGGFVSHCILLLNGLVKEFMEGPGETSLLLRLAAPGMLTGLQDLSGGGQAVCNVAALVPSDVFLIKVELMRKLALENTAFAEVLLDECCQSQRFFYHRLFSLGSKQMHGRLADVLLYLTSENFAGIDIFSVVTRKEIADMCGMSTESAVRMLREMRDDGLIGGEGKSIRVRNKSLLEQVSRVG